MARRQYPLESGERDKRIQLVPQVITQDASGFPTTSDGTPTITMFASKQDIFGRERQTADQLSAPYTTRWEMNYRADIDPDVVDVPKSFKLVYQGRRYDITTASMIGRREGVELLTLGKSG